MDIFDYIDTELSKTSASLVEDNQWVEQPITFKDFFTSKDHCGYKQLSKIQEKAITDFIGDDPKQFFSKQNDISTMVLLWGKGSGKDWLSSIIARYVVYLLLCMKSPQKYFGFEDGAFDIVNVAHNSKQAKRVYFKTYFIPGLKKWKWLTDKYTIKHSNKVVNPKEFKNDFGENVVTICENMVSFPNNINCYSEHSQNESFEGYSIIFWIMDEASSFSDENKQANAYKVYNTLTTSASTRFGTRWRGIIISFPREEDDFTIKEYNRAGLPGSKMMRSFGYTWQVRLPGTYSSETFEFEGEQIPMDFKEHFDKEPEDAKCKLMCKPPKIAGGFFDYPEKIGECFIKELKFMMDVEDVIIEQEKHKYVGKIISNIKYKNLDDKRIPRAIWVDQARDKDRCALAMGHNMNLKVEKDIIVAVVIDLLLIWEPDKKKKIRVSLLNTSKIVEELTHLVNIRAIGYDQWNSAGNVEYLSGQGTNVEEHNINREDYTLLRSGIYQGKLYVPWHEPLIKGEPLAQYELERLINKGDNKVDHRVDESKDVADAICGVYRLLQGKEGEKSGTTSIKTLPKSIRGGIPNLFGAGTIKPVINENLINNFKKELLPTQEKKRRMPKSIRF